ncbi:hypothetical protein ACS0TY_029085 [Phlomoides rotata]
MDLETPQKFDNVYFENLVLFTNTTSQPTVLDFARNGTDFNGAFITAMTKLGRVDVKTGNRGEIRTDCNKFNS